MKPKTIAIDMDGTLVDVSSIRHLVQGPKKDFDAFHKESVSCPSIPWVVQAAVEAKRMGFKVIQVTARQEKYRPHTSWWIAENEVPSDGLYMRTTGDFRDDYTVKRELLDNLLRRYDIVKSFDDNPSIWTLWEEYGVECVKVPGWEDYG